MGQKKAQGRRKKIDNKKIDQLGSRQVSFSKCLTGVFNEASELCVLTGAEAVILVESPDGRVYAFGSPSVESVMGCYLGESSSGVPDQQQPGSEPDRTVHEEYNQQHSEISKELEEPVKYIAAMEKLGDNLKRRAKEVEMTRDNPSDQNPRNNNNDVFPVDDYDFLANESEDDLGYDFITFDDEQI